MTPYITDVCSNWSSSVSHSELDDAFRNFWRSSRSLESHEMQVRYPTRFKAADSFQRSSNNNDAGLGLTVKAWAIVDGGLLHASRRAAGSVAPSSPFDSTHSPRARLKPRVLSLAAARSCLHLQILLMPQNNHFFSISLACGQFSFDCFP